MGIRPQNVCAYMHHSPVRIQHTRHHSHTPPPLTCTHMGEPSETPNASRADAGVMDYPICPDLSTLLCFYAPKWKHIFQMKKKKREKFVLCTILVFSCSVRFGSVCITFFMLVHSIWFPALRTFSFWKHRGTPGLGPRHKRRIIMYKRNDRIPNRYRYAWPHTAAYILSQRQWIHHQSPIGLNRFGGLGYGFIHRCAFYLFRSICRRWLCRR